MKLSMLAYTKLSLEKVSFNRELYEREYRKALTRLSPQEVDQLQRWTRHRGQQLTSMTVAR